MNYSKVLIVKQKNSNSFERFYADEIEKRGCAVIEAKDIFPEYRKGKLQKAVPMFKLMVSNDLKQKLACFELIVVFEYRMLIPILWSNKAANAQIILWQWNTPTPEVAKKINMLKPFCEIWTFDPGDAERYNWHLNTQFYFLRDLSNEGVKQNNNSPRAFFVGVDKGRYKQTRALYQKLVSGGVKCDFHLLKDPNSTYKRDDAEWLTDQLMPYDKLLNGVQRSDIIVELVKPDQKGLTVRALEAAFYNKKLITNNPEIKKSELYNPNNVLVISDKFEHELKEFLELPYHILPNTTLSQFTFESWLKNFFR